MPKVVPGPCMPGLRRCCSRQVSSLVALCYLRIYLFIYLFKWSLKSPVVGDSLAVEVSARPTHTPRLRSYFLQRAPPPLDQQPGDPSPPSGLTAHSTAPPPEFLSVLQALKCSEVHTYFGATGKLNTTSVKVFKNSLWK